MINELSTMTGISLEDALKKLATPLPPKAYKKVSGKGVEFTDISPAWLTKVANDVFGPCGIGWTFSFLPEHLTIETRIEPKSSGGDRRFYAATISLMEVKFRYKWGDEWLWSEPIVSNGYHENADLGWAERGAITNALGAAFSKLNWQWYVYSGQLDHNNISAYWAKRGATEDAMSEGDPDAATKPVAPPANGNGNGKTAAAPAAAAQPAPVSAPAATAVVPAQDSGDPLAWAKATVIPEGCGIPFGTGKTMAEMMADKKFGAAVLKFLTGNFPNQSGGYFQPGDDEAKLAVRKAAIALYVSNADKKQ